MDAPNQRGCGRARADFGLRSLRRGGQRQIRLNPADAARILASDRRLRIHRCAQAARIALDETVSTIS
jgi:hypothetical protein